MKKSSKGARQDFRRRSLIYFDTNMESGDDHEITPSSELPYYYREHKKTFYLFIGCA